MPRVEMPSSISGASLGLSGGWSSLRMPGLSSPEMSCSSGMSDMSLRSEMDDTLRFERIESERLMAETKGRKYLVNSPTTSNRSTLLTICIRIATLPMTPA